MSSMSGYRSPVNLGLGQTPGIADPEMFVEMVGVYNAIHLLNQYLDQLRNTASGGGSGQAPNVSMPFNRFYTGVALQTIAIGDVVSPTTSAGQNGMIKGALAHSIATLAPEANFTGIALTAAAIGEDFRVGVGPAIIEKAGALAGNLIWAYSGKANNGANSGQGGLYNSDPGPLAVGGGTVYAMPVAICPVSGYALFGQYIRR